MGRRTVLIGMNNPLSSDPRYALYPAPKGCTGWRLWQMLAARTGATRSDYLRAFQRLNLTTGPHWSVPTARATWRALEPTLQTEFDTVVLLGGGPRLAADVQTLPVHISRELICIPHPSGRNLWYNIARNRELVEVILEELYVEALT